MRTLFGACPPANDSRPQAVSDRYGATAAVRVFLGNFAAPTGRPAAASVVHWSFAVKGYNVSRDQALKDIAAGKHDAAIAAMAKGVKAGDVVEVMHEGDKKITDGQTTWEPLKAGKTRFYDVVKRANPSVRVANTVTGWLADPSNKRFVAGEFARWATIPGDVLGIDLDGVEPKVLPYPDFVAEIREAQKFVADSANPYKSWAVPEFGAPRIAGDGGVERAMWMLYYAVRFLSAGADYVMNYDYDMADGRKYGTQANPELLAWKIVVGAK